MKRSLAALVLAMSLIAVPAAGDTSSTVDTVFPRGLPHAPSEDSCYSRRCVWDARHQGNGEGRSLILTRFRGDYLAKPISHRRAHRLQAAWCERPNVTCGGYVD